MPVIRDDNGRYVKGTEPPNPGGRPKRERSEQLWAIMMSQLTDETWTAIIAKAIDQAKRGDKAARKFLADYAIGTPEQRLALYAGESTELTVRYVSDWRGNTEE